MTELLVRARRAIVGGDERAANVECDGGRISRVADYDATATADLVVDLADDEVLLPGLVDSHVHVNDPGRAHWEGFASATAAAAAGGVTTIVDMPLNSIPPTCDVDALALKRRAADGRCSVDVGFWGGAVPGNAAQLPALHEAGVFGFKCFLVPSGVDEFPGLTEPDLRAAMRAIAGFDGLLAVHAEDPSLIADAPPGRAYAGFVRSRGWRPRPRAACTSCTCPVPRHCRSSRKPAPTGCGSPSRPARTTSPSWPRRSPTAPRSSSAARRSATRPTATNCGRASPTG
jgi:allantoinase